MTISQTNLTFATRYYDLIRAWVLYNERHRKAIGKSAPDTQIALDEFVSQYNALNGEA